MKTLITFIGLGSIAAQGATINLTAGQADFDIVESVSVPNPLVQGLTLTVPISVSNTMGTLPATAPLDLSLQIASASDAVGETMAPASIVSGQLLLNGSFDINATPPLLAAISVSISNLSINSDLEIVDNDRMVPAFDIMVTSRSSDADSIQITGDLIITTELSNAANAGELLTGLNLGTVTINATSVPEPSSALLAGLALLGFARRRR